MVKCIFMNTHFLVDHVSHHRKLFLLLNIALRIHPYIGIIQTGKRTNNRHGNDVTNYFLNFLQHKVETNHEYFKKLNGTYFRNVTHRYGSNC